MNRKLGKYFIILVFPFSFINLISTKPLQERFICFVIFEFSIACWRSWNSPNLGTHGVLSVMAIRNQRHTNVSKQTAILVDVAVATPHGAAYIT